VIESFFDAWRVNLPLECVLASLPICLDYVDLCVASSCGALERIALECFPVRLLQEGEEEFD
jgi:hypothetical protein